VVTGRAHALEMIEMAQITLIVGAAALFVAGMLAWFTLWHRRAASSFQRVRVESGRPRVVRRVKESGPNTE
jgi:hypothetical protein